MPVQEMSVRNETENPTLFIGLVVRKKLDLVHA
jgi:hypothetical protein